MTLSRRQVLELCEQFAALHDAELPDADLSGVNLDTAALQMLERRIREDSEVRRLYVRYMRLCAGLAWDMGGGERLTSEQPSACSTCQIGAPPVSEGNPPLPPVASDASATSERIAESQEVRAISETAVQEELPAEPGERPPPSASSAASPNRDGVFLSDHVILFSALVATILAAAAVTVSMRNLGRLPPPTKSEISDLQPEIPDLKPQISVPKVAANPQSPKFPLPAPHARPFSTSTAKQGFRSPPGCRAHGRMQHTVERPSSESRLGRAADDRPGATPRQRAGRTYLQARRPSDRRSPRPPAADFHRRHRGPRRQSDRAGRYRGCAGVRRQVGRGADGRPGNGVRRRHRAGPPDRPARLPGHGRSQPHPRPGHSGDPPHGRPADRDAAVGQRRGAFRRRRQRPFHPQPGLGRE